MSKQQNINLYIIVQTLKAEKATLIGRFGILFKR